MQVVGLPGVLYHVSKLGVVGLSGRGWERLRYVSCFQALREQGLSGSKASQVMGISRASLYRWQRRLREGGARALEDRSHKPRRRRQPTWSPELAEAVHRLREEYPHWGKDKLVVLLWREGWQVSVSMVGRILSRLKARGVLKEPPRTGVASHKKPRPRPYAVRKPKEYLVNSPGGYLRCQTSAWRSPEALYRPGCGFPLGCVGGTQAGHRQHSHQFFG